MTTNVTSHAGPPASAPMRQQGNSPCRILAIDDDENIRRLNVATLTEACYHVMQPGMAQPPGAALNAVK